MTDGSDESPALEDRPDLLSKERPLPMAAEIRAALEEALTFVDRIEAGRFSPEVAFVPEEQKRADEFLAAARARGPWFEERVEKELRAIRRLTAFRLLRVTAMLPPIGKSRRDRLDLIGDFLSGKIDHLPTRDERRETREPKGKENREDGIQRQARLEARRIETRTARTAGVAAAEAATLEVRRMVRSRFDSGVPSYEIDKELKLPDGTARRILIRIRRDALRPREEGSTANFRRVFLRRAVASTHADRNPAEDLHL